MSESNVDVSQLFDGRTFYHDRMARMMIDQYGMARVNKALCIYDGGIYRPTDKDQLHGLILKILPTLKTQNRNEVINYLYATWEMPTREPITERYIPFKTKVFDLETWSFRSYSPDLVFLNRFPTDYNPLAPDTPEVIDTVARIADYSKDLVNLLWECIGSIYCPNNSLAKAFFLYGPGFNGKSTLLNIVETLNGKENTSYLSIEGFGDATLLTGLMSKTANLGDDVKPTEMKDAGHFKSVADGQPIEIRAVYEKGIVLKNRAKLFFCGNAMPSTMDTSDGFFRRFLVIPLKHNFKNDPECDYSKRGYKWTDADTACMTRLAMSGLSRLMMQGFTETDAVKEANKEYRLQADPLEAFIDHVTVDGFHRQSDKEMYQRYLSFCAANGYKQNLNSREFKNNVLSKLSDFGIEWKSFRPGHNATPIRGFVLAQIQPFTGAADDGPLPFE